MTNDSKKGWRYKRDHDANQRKRRDPERRRIIERFRRTTRNEATCESEARTAHGGPLEVQHAGGLRADPSKDRLKWFCRKHNREDAGLREDPPAWLLASRLLGALAVIAAILALLYLR